MANYGKPAITAQYSRQDGRTAVVTGTGGLGFEVATKLADLGARVIIAGRNAQKGHDAVAGIAAAVPGAELRFEVLDLAALASVKDFTGRMIAQGGSIDLLVNNAGIMSPPQRRVTVDGFEAQFATNHLGHFALTAGLLPLLRKSGSARVVSVTSIAHRYGRMDFDDLQCERKYQPGVAYCRSKLAVALFARTLHQRARAQGWALASMAAHPGFAGTNLFAAEGGPKSFMTLLSTRLLVPLLGHSAAAGADPILHASLSPHAESGRLYGPTGFLEMRGATDECPYGASALDDEAGERLWRLSEELAGVSFGA
ncbi:SDR family oxidoreductase [Novosphingobium sp.]|uniref:SDR family oxidoreductase n=1 Tax=Novosphingobium sp. TaxID=1874826 RepID=UPI00286D71A3|nr:SDR family oxidoreductase [Novosphingobium sp.]